MGGLLVLDLSNNHIQNLFSLNLKKLVKLKLEGNQVGNPDQVALLPNESLQFLSFRTYTGSQTNPMCGHQNYKETVRKTFGTILSLDYNNPEFELPTFEFVGEEVQLKEFHLGLDFEGIKLEMDRSFVHGK